MIFPIFPMIPMVPIYNEKPPTLYSIMNSIVNYQKEERVKIPELAKYSRSTIFNFTYPLDESVNKEDFECMILNHFIKRRIGTETFTEFQLNLKVKMNEIMPIYNKLFSLLANNDGFGEITTKEGTSDTNSSSLNTKNSKSDGTTSSVTDTDTETKNSVLPQSKLENVASNKYINNYTVNNSNGNDNTNSNVNTEETTNNDSNDSTNYRETTSTFNMFEIYSQIRENIFNIYSMIFNDLDELFYAFE